MSKSDKKRCEVEVFSRVCGFFRPLQAWNPGKLAEHSDKKTYKVGDKDVLLEEKG